MELKKDPWVISLAGVSLVTLAALTAIQVLTWPEMAAGIVLLGLPSVFGRTPDEEQEKKP